MAIDGFAVPKYSIFDLQTLFSRDVVCFHVSTCDVLQM